MLNREDYLKEFAKDKNIVNLVKNNQLTREDINNNFKKRKMQNVQENG